MTWRPTSRRTVPTEPGAKTNTVVVPQGTMRWLFTMKVEEGFSKEVEELCDLLKGEWSKAAVVRLAVERFAQELRGEPRVQIELLRKGGSLSGSPTSAS